MDTRSKTDSRCTLTSGENSAMSRFLNVFQNLRFGCTGVTEEKNIEVSTNGVFSIDIFRDTTEERQRNGGLDVLVAIDTWGNRVVDPLGDIGFSAESLNFAFVILAQSEAIHLIGFLRYILLL